MSTATEISEAAGRAFGLHLQWTVIECAGLFWLGAELVILFFVLEGRRHLECDPIPDRFRFSPGAGRRAGVWAAAFLLLCAGALGRHTVWPPLHSLLETGGLGPAAVYELALGRERGHLGVWGVFVAGWVVLEAAIVYHGWRGYQRLRVLLGAP